MDHFGSALALRFGLAGDGADHLLGQIHLFHFHHRNLDSPGRGVLIENSLQPQIQFLALAQQLIELGFSKHAPQRGLRELGGAVKEVIDLHHRQARLDDPKEDDRIHLHGDIVLGHHVLGWNFDGVDAQGNAHDAVDGGEDQDHARAFGFGQEAPQAKDHAALILGQDLDGREQVQDDDDDHDGGRFEHNYSPDGSGLTASWSPWIPTTRTLAPGSTTAPNWAMAFQYSPRTWTLPSGASWVIATPASPTMPAEPATTSVARARITRVSRTG